VVPPPGIDRFITLGSPSEDRLRTAHLLGQRSATGFLVRSASSLMSWSEPDNGGLEWALILPEWRTVWNSAIPFSPTDNDGALWAGRGLNLQAMGGVRGRYGPVSLVLAPQVVYQENRDFQTIPYPESRTPRRDHFASPWHFPPSSLDLPSRLGEEALTRVDLGQSSLTLDLGPAAIGAATEHLWWGPGIRNAIVMSNNAAGIPHLFLRTSGPLATPLGEVEGRWILGRLTESEFFDTVADNDHRSISALAVAFRPGAEPDLTLGFARAVYALPTDGAVSPGAAFDVFRSVRRRGSADADGTSSGTRRDQVLSLFGRWIFPESGFETYFEWARFEQPRSFREVLTSPHRSQGYTLGLQWAKALARSSVVRLQSELTYLEPSSAEWDQIRVSSYASPSVPHGYTQRGQIIGASIGPGASSQWIAADYLAPAWQVGLFGGRIRWETAAFHRLTPRPSLLQHDVSLFAGLRGGYRFRGLEATAEAAVATRFNYLFQNRPSTFDDILAVDLRNYSLRLELRPAARPR
jgi:hypothetical protein